VDRCASLLAWGDAEGCVRVAAKVCQVYVYKRVYILGNAKSPIINFSELTLVSKVNSWVGRRTLSWTCRAPLRQDRSSRGCRRSPEDRS